jgi:hypothetical protein
MLAVQLLVCLLLSVPAAAQLQSGRVTLASVSLEPASVVGGTAVAGRITLTGAAPVGGITVALTTTDAAVAPVPGEVTVRAGATAAAFAIATRPIGAPPNVVPQPVAVTITGSHRSIDPQTRRVEQSTRAAMLTVLPPVVQQVGVASHALCARQASQTGGRPVTGCVVLTGPAPGFKAGPTGVGHTGVGATVTLTSKDPRIVAVPATVTVAGGQTRASFAITTSPVAVDTQVVVTAQRAQTESRSATLTVLAPRLLEFTLGSASVQGGQSIEGIVRLTGPVAAGAQVVVDVRTSGGGQAVSVPGSVTIFAGQDATRVGIRTQPVTATTVVTIGASYGGVTKSVTLTVAPAPAVALTSLTCSPASTVGGGSTTCTVRLTGPAPAAGAPVSLSSNAPAVVPVPAGSTITAGQTAAAVVLTAAQVASPTSVTISASYGGSTKTFVLSVVPRADLSIHSYRLTTITGQPMPDTSGAFDLYVTVANAAGAGVAPASTSRVQVTSNQPVFGYPQSQTAPTPALNPGARAESRFRFNGLSRGYTFTFALCADVGNVVAETSETNNCTTFQITQH